MADNKFIFLVFYLNFLILLNIFSSNSLPLSEFYPYGSTIDNTLEQGDEISSDEVPLTVPIKFFEETYDSIFVNTNGLLSFIYEVPYFSNIEFPLEYPVIAPLYSNVDTTSKGRVFFRETNDSSLLQRATANVHNYYPNLPHDYEAKSLFITTWDHVGYHEAGEDKLNTFQAVVSTDGKESFVEMLYADGGIQWMQATNPHGLPEARAQAGIVAPGGKFYTLRGSGTDQVINLDKWTNADRPGLFIFRIGNINDTGNVEAPLHIYEGFNEGSGEPQSCYHGGTYCHSNADCHDEPEGYCCRCQPSYFGNGRSCLERETARRIFGKLKLHINGVSLQDLDFHGYIVTKDGKIYIAVNNLPETIGREVQLLFTLTSLVGWLFASPKGNAKNGYMLTGGVLNHTADITFDNYYRVTINQKYTGLNLFDHIRMEGEVHGNLPDIPDSAALQMPDFHELYTRTEPGQFRSSTTHEMVLNQGQTYTVNVHQTINFIEHCKAEENDMASMRMESTKNYIDFDKEQSILRFASFNKIFRGSENTDDPCIEGKRKCVANSSCLVNGDGFICVCNQGFRALHNNLYPESQTDFGCVDINECVEDTNTCHQDAICINEVGAYSCQCRYGYTGDGRYCQSIQEDETPENAVCHVPGDYSTCECQDGFEMIGASTPARFACEDIDECARSPVCPDGAVCINLSGNYSCRCRDGYEGDDYSYCYQIDPCNLMVCPDNTECEIRDGSGHCVCRNGYQGTPPNCSPEQLAIYEEPSDCSNIECPRDSSCIYKNGRAVCYCNAGFQGTPPNCKPIRSDNCGEPCHENAQCIYLHNEGTYKCVCKAGFEGDGLDCQLMELSCHESEYCHFNATCIHDPNLGRAICICKDGFEGDGTACYPTGECLEDSDCGSMAQCYFNYYNERYECACIYDYVRNSQGDCVLEDQTDICERCHPDADCAHHYGQKECICRDGYEGDGIECRRKKVGCEVLGGCSEYADCRYNLDLEMYVCQCGDGYYGNGSYCEPLITCYQEPDLCSIDAICTYQQDTYVCECNDGFYGNGTYCKEARKLEEEFLLLNKGRTILRVPFNPTRTDRGRPIHIGENQTAIGIATDCVDGRVYWSDIINFQVKSSKYDGTDYKVFKDTEIQSPEGLAIDWINREIYWTDSGIDKIVAVNLDTGEGRIVASENLVNPRGIAVNPHRRKVYWSDWNREAPKIEWANLDGSDRQILVQSPAIKLPNSLAIDWSTEELCWADAGTKTIECLNVESNRRRTIVKNCSYPYGLAITDNKYYWTDWNTLKLESSTKQDPSSVKSIDLPLGGSDKVYGVVAVTSCP